MIKRPKNFLFRPGDWVFLKVPTIARYEWHPFTISSSPERRDELWLHIRSAGHWTKRLYDYFKNYEDPKWVADIEGVQEDVSTSEDVHELMFL